MTWKVRGTAPAKLCSTDLTKIGVTGFEPATTRPPDEHSTTELHPVTNLIFRATNFLQEEFWINIEKLR